MGRILAPNTRDHLSITVKSCIERTIGVVSDNDKTRTATADAISRNDYFPVGLQGNSMPRIPTSDIRDSLSIAVKRRIPRTIWVVSEYSDVVVRIETSEAGGNDLSVRLNRHRFECESLITHDPALAERRVDRCRCGRPGL